MKEKRILVINGPNINMLGIRETQVYGRQTYEDLLVIIEEASREVGIQIEEFQSNHEGDIVDRIQEAYDDVDGIVINPGAYTHTSIAILDALKAVGIPVVEVHISDVDNREEFRRLSYVSTIAEKIIKNRGIEGYRDAIIYLSEKL